MLHTGETRVAADVTRAAATRQPAPRLRRADSSDAGIVRWRRGREFTYHDDWTERSSRRKFDEMLGFARALPKLRRAVTRDLKRDAMPRERALAVAVRLLDVGLFRVGGEHYAEENGSYGLATIRREHVSVSGSEMIFDFPAKSGQRRRQSIRDASVARAGRYTASPRASATRRPYAAGPTSTLAYSPRIARGEPSLRAADLVGR